MTFDPFIILIIVAAAFVQGVSGFGLALVAMPVLTGLTSIYVAVPLAAMLTLTSNILLWIYYRQACNRSVVLQLLLGAVLGLPFGFLALRYVPVNGMLVTLGFMLIAYAVYALAKPVIPVLQAKNWRYGAGFLAGVLMGGYNLPGPPVILYGDSQRWVKSEFKGNLSRFFGVNAFLAVLGHGLQNRITMAIAYQYLSCLPGLFLGLFLGIVLSRFFNPIIFRKSVLGLLLIMGIRLILLGIQS